uniref:Reverse transcriptase Ty1/copia-type domain-containing protein n=1 Tax=Solanum lycopersicum TaxID=4081 RepID=A0A3Q7HZ12_SOLLC
MGSCETLVAEFKSFMMKEFETSELGVLQYFLGLRVKRVEAGFFVSQKKYEKDLLFKFGSGAISRSSKKQDMVALSSSEAEYVAVTSAAFQAFWL